MKNNLCAALVGFLFSLGLAISGMTQTKKVIGFLDVFGKWDPSLLFVMLGAVAVHLLFYRQIMKRKSPVFSEKWHVPQDTKITLSLVLGSVIFGVGWGIAGYCPGPALTLIASTQPQPLLFVVCMLFGMYSFKKLDQKFKIKR